MGSAVQRVIAYQFERVVARLCQQLQEPWTALTSESLDDGRRSCADELRGNYTRAGACCAGTDNQSLQNDGAHACSRRMQRYGQARYPAANNGNVDIRLAAEGLRLRPGRCDVLPEGAQGVQRESEIRQAP